MGTIIFYSIFLVLITLFGIHDPSNSIEWLVAATDNLDALRLSIALLLVSTFSLPLSAQIKKAVFGSISVFCLGILAGNLIIPDSYRQAGLYFRSLDIVALLEGGIIAGLQSLRVHETEETVTQHTLPGKAHLV